MSHGSYDSNLSSEILILAGDIRSRSWPNIGGTYGIIKFKNSKKNRQIEACISQKLAVMVQK
jgi:hypothetical protein